MEKAISGLTTFRGSFLFPSLLLLLSSLALTVSNSVFASIAQDENGLAVAEAESFDAHQPSASHAWSVTTPPEGFSGSTALAALPDSRSTIRTNIAATSPRLDYNIVFQQTGPHRLWLHGFGMGGGGNSVFAGLDGVVESRSFSFPLNAWGWVAIDVDIPDAGLHVASIWMREDGTLVDRLLFTNDLDFIPVGLGPEASNPPQPVLQAVDDNFFVDPDTVSNSFAVLENDSAGEGELALQPFSAPPQSAEGGDLSISADGLRVLYTPATGYVGADSFSYSVTDDSGDTASAVVLVTVGIPPVPVFLFNSDGQAVVEAESADTATAVLEHRWDFVASTNDVGGSGYLFAVPERRLIVRDSIELTSPSFSTQILFQQPGEHLLWVRGFGESGGADSVWAGINDQVVPAHIVLPRGAWGWVPHTIDVPSAGPHEIKVWMREDSSRVDRLLITADQTFTPTGIGPPESVFSDGGAPDPDDPPVDDDPPVTNSSPLANPDSLALLNVGLPVVIDVLGNDSDPDGDTLTIDQAVTDSLSSAGGAVVVDEDTQQVSYNPPADFAGIDQFNYGVSDGNGGSATALVTIDVTLQNTPPVAVPDSLTIEADAEPVLLNVKLNDTDVNGDQLQISAELTELASAMGGTVAIDAGTDQLIYTPPPGFVGLDTFLYGISDGREGTATALVTITIEAPNLLPIANDDSIEVSQNAAATSIPVLLNDDDPDGNELLINPVTTATTSAQGGVVTVAVDRLSLLYQPATDFTGDDQLVYFVADSRGGVASATVTISVVPPQLGPVALDDEYVVAFNSTNVDFSVLDNDTDENGDSLRVSAELTPISSANGAVISVAENGSSITYTAPADFNGFDSFPYTIVDPGGLSATANVTVAVGRINVAPVANDDAVAISPNLENLLIDVLENDRDANADPLVIDALLTAESSTAGGIVTVASDNLSLRYSAPADFTGIDTFSYSISDGDGGEATGVVRVLIGEQENLLVQNQFGVLSLEAELATSSTSTQSSAWTSFNSLPGFSGEGYMVAHPDAGITLTETAVDSPQLRFNVFFLAAGEHNLWIRGYGPRAGSDSVFVALDGQLQGTDVDIPRSEWDWVSMPLFIAQPGVHELSLRMREDGTQIDKIVVLSDLEQTLSGVGPPASTQGNTPPVATEDVEVVQQDVAFLDIDVLANDTDPNGDPLSLNAVMTDSISEFGAALVVVGNQLRYTPAVSAPTGIDRFAYAVADDRGGVSIGTVTVEFVEPPQPSDDSFTVSAGGGRVALDVLANDGSAELSLVASITAVQSDQGGLVLIDPISGKLFYEPSAGLHNSDSFSYGVVDSAGAEATADVLINLVQEGVTGEAPALQEIGDRSVEEAREYRLQIRATNPDGPPPAFTDPVGLPDTAVFTDRGDGTAELVWDTSGVAPGTSVPVEFGVVDSAGLIDSELVTFSIIPAGTFSFFTQGTDTARLYGVHEIVLAGDGEVENQFLTPLQVEFRHVESGSSRVVKGFYDGQPDGVPTWRARLYPELTGTWIWTSTSATDPLMDGLSGTFTVEGSDLAGMLQTHAENPRQWQTANGETFVNLSDTAYLLFNTEVPEEDFELYVNDDIGKGVTSIRAGGCGGFGRWNPGVFGNNWCWSGRDFARYDLGKFRHTDEKLKWLLDNAPHIYIQLIMFGNSTRVGEFWEEISPANREAMLDYMIARWGAWPQLYYLIINDTRYDDLPANQRMIREIGPYLKNNSTWERFVSTGPKRREDTPFVLPSDFAEWHNYLHIERFSDVDGTVSDLYAEFPVHTYLGEDWYEQFGVAPGNPTDPTYYYRRLFWATLLSGGSPAYGSRAIVTHPYSVTGERPYVNFQGVVQTDQLVGLDAIPHLSDFLADNDIDFAIYQPADELASDPNRPPDAPANDPSRPQVAISSDSFLIYLPNAMPGELPGGDEFSVEARSRQTATPDVNSFARVRIDLRSASSSRQYTVLWQNPVDGTTVTGDPVAGGQIAQLQAPWLGVDAVLLLRVAP